MPLSLRRAAARAILALVAALAATAAFAGQAHAAATPGVQAHLLWSGVKLPEVQRQMDAAKAAGSRMLRVDVGWASLEETGRGQWNAYHLGRLDAVVAEAEARDLELLLTFWRTPCWASSAPETLKQGCTGSWWSRGVELHTPTDPAEYARALAYVAARYGNRVAGWEIWNEPNSSSYYKAPDPVRDYVALLRAAYPAAKAAAPDVPVVGGSLMHADFAWTEQAYAAGAKGAFDAWSIHPYSDDRSPKAGAPDPAWKKLSFAEGVPAVRDVLLAHGDDKPLWLTEFGWHTSTIRDQAAWKNGVSRETQATFVAEALEHVAQWPWVRAIIAFNVKDTGTDPASRIDNFGLHDTTLAPKPAAAAFRAAADALVAGTAGGSGAATPCACGTGEGGSATPAGEGTSTAAAAGTPVLAVAAPAPAPAAAEVAPAPAAVAPVAPAAAPRPATTTRPAKGTRPAATRTATGARTATTSGTATAAARARAAATARTTAAKRAAAKRAAAKRAAAKRAAAKRACSVKTRALKAARTWRARVRAKKAAVKACRAAKAAAKRSGTRTRAATSRRGAVRR